MKISYKMFHTPGNEDRENLYLNAKNIFSKYKELDSLTYKISSYKDYLNFYNNNIEFNIIKEGYSLDGEQGWRYGEIGIWASNWKAWNTFVNSDYDYLILMEDDLVCENDLPETIEKYIEECPKDFDALYINVPADQFHKYNSFQNITNNLTRAYQDWSCACYVVQKNTIGRLIQYANRGISLPLDWFMFRQQDIFNIYTVNPNSYKGCFTKQINSTFQTIQERRILDGIL